MKLLFYSDPHLGKTRQAHTTPASAKRLRDRLLTSPLSYLMANEYDGACCLGDVFDSYSNEEEIIVQGSRLAEYTDLIMAGNHDVVNRAEKMGSLQLLKHMEEANPANFVIAEYGDAVAVPWHYGSSTLIAVPHCSDQTIFEKALELAEAIARDSGDCWKILLLHCNYALDERFLVSGDALNLSQERAYRLLKTFHRILIGHEHNARQDINTDRIQLLGATFPSRFDDLTDKFVWIYDTEENTLEPALIWSASLAFRGKASALSDDHYFDFYDLEDDLPPGACSKLVNKLYANENTLAVRVTRPETTKRSEAAVELGEVSKLPDLVQTDLEKQHPDLLPAFKELRHAAENQGA